MTQTNMIVNISEDAWFGNSIGPHQHFTKAPIYGSIENNTYLIRSANKGISAFINNNGKTIKRLEPNETGNIELDVPLINNSVKNKNDLIFFILLFTYLSIFLIFKNKNQYKIINIYLLVSPFQRAIQIKSAIEFQIWSLILICLRSFSRVACETLTTTNKVILAGETRGPKIAKENYRKS